MKDRFAEDAMQVLVGWGTGSVEEFLESYPEYRKNDNPQRGRVAEGDTIDG
jgi:hypothetical protein